MRGLIAVTCVAFIVLSCGDGDASERGVNEPVSGEKLYKTHCALCHGADGRKGLAGAKMIPESELSIEDRIALITSGKGSMMPYRDVLSNEEIARVAAYTLTLE